MKRAFACLLLSVGLAGTARADSSTERLLAWANSLRLKAGAPPLAADQRLEQTARRYAEELASAGVLSHRSPTDGGGAAERYRRQGGTEITIGEILGAGPTLADIERAWEESESHRAAALEGRFTHLGAGSAFLGSQQVWVVLFARKAIEELSISERGGYLYFEGRLGEGRALAPYAEVAETLQPLEPSAWNPKERRFAYRVPVPARAGHWLLGFLAEGGREITNSITWPAEKGLPEAAGRYEAPPAPP